ncbi:MAG: ribonuclease E/G [Holosporaceae bacterium]|jgi:ribonuclease E|nr:ribonuclease E/G [Holosporaceae bacterium]
MEEIRVAVVDGDKLDKFDFEIPSKAQVKGNIYLAKIVRVEPSLQAAFVDYGGDRHGFLSFSEIHHDYFQIPVGDRQDLECHIQNAITALLAESGSESEEDLDPKEISKLRYQFYRRYKIQEVIKKRQIMLVQVVKEERGNKGAALTTYIALAGRYCVLMPNTAKGSGVSRKVVNHDDRQKLKKIIADLQIENGSAVIRTAGIGHSKTDITKDFNYLKKMWDEIRETTVKSTAPCLIHEEAGIIKRAIRDLYSRDIDSIFVEGEDGYKIAKSFVKKLMPSQVKKVKLYEERKLPLFVKFKINDQINQIYSTRVDLPSGGYLVINTTEAMISIDVNSGKATRERSITETALKTNLEAAVEIARQCRLRDLAGLIVVDFIDMAEKRNNVQVERCLRDALREDKAKIQIGSISNFGLLEFSRQRLRSSIADANMILCPHCSGVGFIWSNESIAIQVLRKIEETITILNCSDVTITLSLDVATYLMNYKRSFISGMEERSGSKINFKIDVSIAVADFKIEPTSQHLAKENDAASPQNSAEKPPFQKPISKEKERNSNFAAAAPKNTKEPREQKEPREPKEIEKKVEDEAEISEVISLPAKEERREHSRRNSRNRRRRNHGNRSSAVESTESAESAELSQETKNIPETPPKQNYSFITDDDPGTGEPAKQLSIEELSKRTNELFALHEAAIANALKVTDQYKNPEDILVEKKNQSKKSSKEKNKWWQQLIRKAE